MKKLFTLFVLVSLLSVDMLIAQGTSSVISYLEIVDINTGERELVKSIDSRIEAPNWTTRWKISDI